MMIKNQKRNKLLHRMIITLLVSLVILSSPLYVKGRQEKTDEIRTNLIENSLTLNLDTVKVDPKAHSMEATFTLETSSGDTPELQDIINLVYEVKVASKVNNQEYKPTIVRVTDQYFVVNVPNIPEEFDFMRFKVQPTTTDAEKKQTEYSELTFYIPQDHVQQVALEKNKTKENYLLDFVDFKDKQTDQLIKKVEKEIKSSKKQIQINLETIDKLSEEMTYQLEEEQERTKSTIQTLERENDGLLVEIETKEKTVDEMKEKKELVREKYIQSK